jgi:hypothetical protein
VSPWLVVPLVLLVAWLWLTTRALGRIRDELGEAESRLARRFYKLHGRVAEIDAVVRELDFERRRRRGEIRFTAETRVGDALAVHPRIGEILAAYGLTGAGCGGGSGPPEDATIAEACRGASLDVKAVLGTMERFLADPDAPIQAHAASAKLHGIGTLPLRS